jgi:hypothetical protein
MTLNKIVKYAGNRHELCNCLLETPLLPLPKSGFAPNLSIILKPRKLLSNQLLGEKK